MRRTSTMMMTKTTRTVTAAATTNNRSTMTTTTTTMRMRMMLMLSLFCVICSSSSSSSAAAAGAVSAAEVQLQRQHQHHLEQHHYSTDEEQQQRELQIGQLDEPSRCISLEELIASDSRFIAETNGAVDSQCLAYNGCTMSRTSCCRVNLNLAWLVCDPNNRYVPVYDVGRCVFLYVFVFVCVYLWGSVSTFLFFVLQLTHTKHDSFFLSSFLTSWHLPYSTPHLNKNTVSHLLGCRAFAVTLQLEQVHRRLHHPRLIHQRRRHRPCNRRCSLLKVRQCSPLDNPPNHLQSHLHLHLWFQQRHRRRWHRRLHH